MKLLPTLMTSTLSLVIIGCGEAPKPKKAEQVKIELVQDKIEAVTENSPAAEVEVNPAPATKKADVDNLADKGKKVLDTPTVKKAKEILKYTTETATKQCLSIFEKCMAITKSVTTEADASSALEKLAPLMTQVESLQKNISGVSAPSKAYLSKLMGENKAQANTIKEGLMALATNMVKAPGIYKILQPTIDKLKASLGTFYQPISDMLTSDAVKNISVEGLKKSGLKHLGF